MWPMWPSVRANRRFVSPPKFLDRECSSLLIINSVLTVPRDNRHNLQFWLVVESPPLVFSLSLSRGKRRESVPAAEDRCVATSYVESISLSRKTLNELGRSLARRVKQHSDRLRKWFERVEPAIMQFVKIVTWLFDEQVRRWLFWKLGVLMPRRSVTLLVLLNWKSIYLGSMFRLKIFRIVLTGFYSLAICQASKACRYYLLLIVTFLNWRYFETNDWTVDFYTISQKETYEEIFLRF